MLLFFVIDISVCIYYIHCKAYILYVSFFKEYIPGGRQIYSKHPGSVINQQSLNNPSSPGESILLEKLSQVNISEKSFVSCHYYVILINFRNIC